MWRAHAILCSCARVFCLGMRSEAALVMGPGDADPRGTDEPKGGTDEARGGTDDPKGETDDPRDGGETILWLKHDGGRREDKVESSGTRGSRLA